MDKSPNIHLNLCKPIYELDNKNITNIPYKYLQYFKDLYDCIDL